MKMTEFIMEITLFGSKVLILILLLMVIVAVFGAVVTEHKKSKKKKKKLEIEDMGQELQDYRLKTWLHTRPIKEFKQELKLVKKQNKKGGESKQSLGRVFVLDFKGDIQASQVKRLREEVSILLQSATAKTDEVIVRLHNAGGMVSSHGLAACQLQRLRDYGLRLTVCVDEVAGSGGYLMACVGTQILAAPFAIIGSIGVLAQIPNFYRFLKKQDVDFEEHYAGDHKRNITLFGETTEEKRKKLRQQLESIHESFKNYVMKYRPHLDLAKTATGEHWLGTEAKKLGLVDKLSTSDDYILSLLKNNKVYHISLKEESSKYMQWLNKASLQNTQWFLPLMDLIKKILQKIAK